MKKLIIAALLAAEEAGKAILDVYRTDVIVADNKFDGSPLTVADQRSHEIITRCLRNLLGREGSYQFPVLSEEGKDIRYEEREKWEYFWLVDPLDGTKEFIKRNDEFTVNIALIRRDRPVLGVIYLPVTDTFYFAAEGVGSYKAEHLKIAELACRGQIETNASFREIISNATSLSKRSAGARASGIFRVVGSRSHATVQQEVFLDALRKEYERVEMISAGSSLKFCLVAEGRADIYPRFGPTMEWDTAAGQYIVNESGGEVVSLYDRQPLRYNKQDLRNDPFLCKREDFLIPKVLDFGALQS